MKVVVDASVTLKWLLRDVQEETYAKYAEELSWFVGTKEIAAIQPLHWLPEVAAGLARLSPDTADEDCSILYALALPTADNHAVMKRACQLAASLEHHLFDTLYHAVALEMDAVLVTADRRYLNKAQHVGSIVYLPDWRAVLP